MNRCPLSYDLCGDEKYSARGLKMLSPRLTALLDFNYSKDEQLQEATRRASKLSIQGVQPKLSVRLNAQAKIFEIVDRGGTFILKPPHMIFPELVANEDVTMRLARASGIDTPVHGMIYARDGTLSYIIRRFDRIGHNKRLAVEDFAQLSEKSRETKYDSSMENVAHIIERFCTFAVLEKLKLFRLTIFSFLIGNEDMHLKNFSLITKDDLTMLSPAYDLLNSTIAINTVEELALPLMGKRSKISAKIIFDYFGKERLKLANSAIADEHNRFSTIMPTYKQILDTCFLSAGMRKNYLAVLEERTARLFG